MSIALDVDPSNHLYRPPGTGKTSTICGLISAATERRPRPLSTNRSPPAKILVCAPSNAAIDEIAYRLKEGYRGSVKSDTPVKVVRLGSGVGEAVRDVELNFLVDQALGLAENGKDQGTEAGLVAMRQELQRLNQDTKALKIELDSTHDNSARVASLNKELAQLTAKRQQLGREFDKKKDERRDERKAQDKQRRNAQAEVLQNAEVICTTLSGAGHKTLQDAYLEFDVIIIDEAAQAIELSTLIPLKFPCKRCILVGDPNQLPPTVLSGQVRHVLQILLLTSLTNIALIGGQISIQPVPLCSTPEALPPSRAFVEHPVSYAPGNQRVAQQTLLRREAFRWSRYGCSNCQGLAQRPEVWAIQGLQCRWERGKHAWQVDEEYFRSADGLVAVQQIADAASSSGCQSRSHLTVPWSDRRTEGGLPQKLRTDHL